MGQDLDPLSRAGCRQAGLAEDALVLMGASRLRAKAGPSVGTASVLVTGTAPQLGTQGHGAMRLATFQLLSCVQQTYTLQRPARDVEASELG